ncbi:hypothetical protein DM860_017451 [Cuscuta australis]|uniref:Uncharacterized protein n=1 Tax=Cuscuta australis TaxID=267555 RepID=A0A328DEW1_9ASTE|nr:hypothetical protein DM860_017451 [Cuscuta australis]
MAGFQTNFFPSYTPAPPHSCKSPPQVSPFSPGNVPPSPPPINPPPSSPKVAPPHPASTPPPPHYPSPQPPSPRPPRPSIPPPSPVVKPPPPHILPPPSPAVKPPPQPGHHSHVIIIAFVSLGGLFFLAFLSVALCCFIKKRKKRMVQESDVVKVDEHIKVHETIVPGPHGTQTTFITIDDDLHIDEEVKKHEKNCQSLVTKGVQKHPQAIGASTRAPTSG